MEPYIQRDDFKPEIIEKVSKACTSICKWGIAMYTYYMVSLQGAPKRAALAEAQASLEVTKKELADAKDTLAEVEAKVAALNAKLDEANGKKKDLQDQSDRCEAQLERAGKLIGGLGGEKVRWNNTIVALTRGSAASSATWSSPRASSRTAVRSRPLSGPTCSRIGRNAWWTRTFPTPRARI